MSLTPNLLRLASARLPLLPTSTFSSSSSLDARLNIPSSAAVAGGVPGTSVTTLFVFVVAVAAVDVVVGAAADLVAVEVVVAVVVGATAVIDDDAVDDFFVGFGCLAAALCA